MIENTSICISNIVVREEHVYLDYRAFFQKKWINGPDRKYFKEHTGRDMAFEKARGIEIGFGRHYGVDTLVILSPMPSSLENVEEEPVQRHPSTVVMTYRDVLSVDYRRPSSI